MFISNLFTDPIYFFQVASIVIFSIVLHELSHGWAALKQGDNTPLRLGHMTLNPVVHMGIPSLLFLALTGMAWGCMPVTPCRFRDAKWGYIWVSAAGPLMNLAIALVMAVLLNVSTLIFPWGTEFLYMGARLNIVLCLFNLLPCPPLDGFAIASELFPELQPLRKGYAGLLCLVILFQIPGLGTGLWAIADALISTVSTL